MNSIQQRRLFLSHLGQTSEFPLALEIIKAEGLYLHGSDGKKYIDLIAGISVSNLGHAHPRVIEAAKKQLDKHLHLMVYGEFIQSSQVAFAKLLADHLPAKLQSVYFVNSGAESVEGALKLAKRFTGRTRICAFKKSYHGSTHGALSVMGDEALKNPFRPLLPGVDFLRFNCIDDLSQITEKTACVIVETIQGEAGAVIPSLAFMQALRARCTETGSLLILDEIQAGLGRTGTLFAFNHYGIEPDILLLAKALGGGMPLGAFISSVTIMSCLMHDPALGHITTFGGHPVSCATGMEAFRVLLEERLTETVEKKEKLFRALLVHPAIKDIPGKGLLLGLEFESPAVAQTVMRNAVQHGLITDWFLFNDKMLRIAPPLIITSNEIETACAILLQAIQQAL